MEKMASLKQLLAQEGFEHSKRPPKSTKSLSKSMSKSKKQEHRTNITTPEPKETSYMCADRNLSKLLSNVSAASPPAGKEMLSEEILTPEKAFQSQEMNLPLIDEVAVRAVISILSGHAQKFLEDQRFRDIVREKCNDCMALAITTNSSASDIEILTKLELGMESIERLVEENQHLPCTDETITTAKMNYLKNLIRLLGVVASLNSSNSGSGSTCGVPNSYLSACAQLYLSFLYKLLHNSKNHPNTSNTSSRVCAKHLLQVFCDNPLLARTHLLPDLWERLILPHLLHLKIWLAKEVDFISGYGFVEREAKMKVLKKTYNDGMNLGTKRLALYYKEWLKTAVVDAPMVPLVSLPSNPRRSSESFSSRSSPSNNNLFRDVFGLTYERRTRSMDIKHCSSDVDLDEEEEIGSREDNLKLSISAHTGNVVRERLSSQNKRGGKSHSSSRANKLGYSRFWFCRTEPSAEFIHKKHVAIVGKFSNHFPSTNLSRAISTICTSDSLSDCEMSMRVVAKAWLDSHGDPVVEATLSKAPVIEGMLEVLSGSNDNEILEIVISIVAELVSRRKANREIVLNAEPQLEIFARLLRSSSLFLKSSVLIYLLKPEVKHMVSVDWIPLVLRILEFGDQMQTLFSVQCCPKVAAFYLLEQLLRSSDMFRNVENARKVVSLGGLNLLLQTLEIGDKNEKSTAALYISSCIKADGNCRYYIADNVNKSSILDLLVPGNQLNYGGCALTLLTDLLCLNRRTEITKFLNGLKNGGLLNTMHMLLVYLQRAPLEQRPLVAAILLQLDLLGDPLQSSFYREEVVDAIVESLDSNTCSEKVQEQLGRALLLLGGRFSYVGEAVIETWLLKQAGYDRGTRDLSEDEEETEEWLRKTTTALLISSNNKRLLTALSESMMNAIPFLSGASLITVAWISWSLRSIKDEYLQTLACSIFAPKLLEALNYDRQLEKRVLASFSLLCLVKNSEKLSKYVVLDKNIIVYLRNLSLVTWTAEELLSIAMNGLINNGNQSSLMMIK